MYVEVDSYRTSHVQVVDIRVSYATEYCRTSGVQVADVCVSYAAESCRTSRLLAVDDIYKD